MSPTVGRDGSDAKKLLSCRSEADREALLADLFTRYRPRLRHMVNLRIHPRLRGRIGPSDVLQEAFLDAMRALPKYVRDLPMPVFLWLRRVTADKLHDMHRHHLRAKIRDARREVRLHAGPAGPEASSVALVHALVRERQTPSEAAMRAEEKAAVQAALDALDPMDREILVLRYFEKLSGVEAARVLGIKEDAARKRYVRALQRLRKDFEKLPRPKELGDTTP